MDNLGYTKPVYILAFDHRASFAKGIFGIEGQWSAEQLKNIQDYKYIIYQGLLSAIEAGVPKESAAVLVDELTGDQVLREAKEKGIATILTTEKSGQEEFAFEFGDNFGEHIQKYQPTFTKALVRYNADNDPAMNERQREKLKQLSDYSHNNGLKFLIEPLIPPTPLQLSMVAGDKHRFDDELRADLVVRMIEEMNSNGVNPDIWKIEGLNSSDDYKKIVTQAHNGGRNDVSIVVLGRGESEENVEHWLNAGKVVPGVLGFAIGRTIFLQPLIDLYQKKIGRDEAIKQICNEYLRFYKVFTE